MIYFSIQNIQDKYNELYLRSQLPGEFLPVLNHLFHERKYISDVAQLPRIASYDPASITDFGNLLKDLYIEFPREEILLGVREEFREYDFLSGDKDVAVLHSFEHAAFHMHLHSSFELNYVLYGSCTLHFEKETINMEAGDLVIISPNSMHEFEKKGDVFLIPVIITAKTFQKSFFSLLNNDDLVSRFFKEALADLSVPNFLYFKTAATSDLNYIAQKLYVEAFRYDNYSNFCCIQWLNLLFSYILRYCVDTCQFYQNRNSSEFTQIITYIQDHYKTTTLSETAEKFHYSVSRLSLIIKKMTGKSFSEWSLKMKMEDAESYLVHTNKSIAEIAELSGYHSADHFSRTFKQYYGMSPQKYRGRTFFQTSLNH